MSKIGLSTGIFFKRYEPEEINRCINHIARWDVDVVEVLLPRLFVLDIPISPENKAFLLTKEVTIHAPFFINEGYTFCKLGRKEIQKLVAMGKELNAKHIVVHPDLLEDLSILQEFDFPFALENISPKISEKFSLENLDEFFDQNKNLKLALDPGHAKNLTIEQMKIIADGLGNLSELHVKLEDTKDFLENSVEISEQFKIFNSPLIIYEWVNDLKDIYLVIKKTREILKNLK